GDDYAVRFKSFKKSSENRKCPYLRPSFTLWLSGWIHAFSSGLFGYEGHQGFLFRIFLFGNFNALMPGIASGENCDYGSRKAVNSLENLLSSGPHRKNILDKGFCRVGVARFFHVRYRFTNVSVFTGPKLKDRIFRYREWKKFFKD
ncbi:MAG TPA: hypothetical protein VNX68_01640, partial [Nitrosopumilaceae archaeon]|nr:hypothetical protein [Nitrosopumilaceae archaeon]